jgi:hypothetical protein
MILTALLGIAVILIANSGIMPKNPAEFPMLGKGKIKNYCYKARFIVLD